MSGKVFAGNLRIALINALGVVSGGYIGVLNTVKCEIQTPAPDNIDQISKMIGTVGQLRSRAQIPKASNLAITIDDLNDQRVLAFALNGLSGNYTQAQVNVITQAGATVTDEVHSSGTLGSVIQLSKVNVSSVVVTDSAGTTTYDVGDDYTVDGPNGTVTTTTTGAITGAQSLKIDFVAATTAAESVTAPAVLGDWVPVAHRHISGVVVKNAGETTTYVAGTDYTFDSKPGFIKVLAGGSITAGEALKVSYKAPALSGTRVRGGVVNSTLLRVVVQLENLVDNREGYFICPIYQATSSGNNDLFGKQMLVAGLTGAMFLPEEGTDAFTETDGAPFYIDDIADAA